MNIILRINENISTIFYNDIPRISEKILSYVFGNRTRDSSHGAHISFAGSSHHVSDDLWSIIIKLNGSE